MFTQIKSSVKKDDWEHMIKYANDTGKICPRCGLKIVSIKRNSMTDRWICVNKNCCGIW